MKIRINKLLDRALIPDNGGELLFYQRNDDFTIEVVGISGELMTTAHHGSEDALAELALKRLKKPQEAHVVIGGLGMGFTLATVLRLVGDRGKVIVAELVPEVVKWNQGPMGERSGNPLKDPRTIVHQGDVLELIRSGREKFDAILLDTDNGPEGLTQARNDRIFHGAAFGEVNFEIVHVAIHPAAAIVCGFAPDILCEYIDRFIVPNGRFAVDKYGIT